MAKYIVAGEQDLSIDKKMWEIKRQIRQNGGSPLDPELVILALQNITEGKFDEKIKRIVHQFADQVVQTDMTYPPEFRRKSEGQQIIDLAKTFGLDHKSALKYLEGIKDRPSLLPPGCHPQDGRYAIVSPFGFQSLIKGYKDPFSDELYCKSLLMLFEKFQKQRNFYNYRNGQIDSDHLCQTELLLALYEEIASSSQGKNLIWLIEAQLGFSHKGESVNRAREIFLPNEHGLGSVATGAIIYNHPDRCVRFNELDIDCSGDKFAPVADGVFSRSPLFDFAGDRLRFDTRDVSLAHDHFGSVSAFAPQN